MLILAYFAFLNFLCDFPLQTKEIASQKLDSKIAMGMHMFVVFVVFSIGLWDIRIGFWNAIIHGFIDWNAWRYFRNDGEYRNGAHYKHADDYGIFIMMDQFAHVAVAFFVWNHFHPWNQYIVY